MSPYCGHSNIFPCVSNDSTCCDIRILLHEAILIVTEVCKELCIFLEQLNGPFIWPRLINFENFLILKQASLSDENLKVLIHWELHELPVDGVENMALGVKYLLVGVPTLYHAVKRVSSWILDLMVLARDHETHD